MSAIALRPPNPSTSWECGEHHAELGWELRCPVCWSAVRPGTFLVDQAHRLARHLIADHPFELAVIQAALDFGPREVAA